jgi:putative FmdB family regulatory protein
LPLYEYECTACQHRLEKIQKSGARAPRCPACKATTKRLQSAPAIQFKGTGWYVTDYARKGRKGDAAAQDGKGEAAAKDAKDGKGDAAGKTGKEGGAEKAGGAGKDTASKGAADAGKKKDR